jgi:hypothetical protein
MIACKSVVRHQQYAVFPTILGAATLQAFWNTLQMRSIYDEFFDKPTSLFTVTEGALQATFSCLGQAVPWDFVHDFSQLAAEGARQGRLETFDAVYEQEETGFTMWVSLRVVGRLVGKRKRWRWRGAGRGGYCLVVGRFGKKGWMGYRGKFVKEDTKTATSIVPAPSKTRT